MNKNLLFGMFAATSMLLATSCSNEEQIVQSGNEAQVTFSLGLESDVNSRSISDGKKAKKLVYAVYNEANQALPVFDGKTQKTEDVVNYPHTVTINLAKGQNYKIAFWAQDPSNTTAYNTADLTNVTVDYTAANNDESRDAFFWTETITVTRNESKDIVLKRPFAQINVGVHAWDWKAAVASGVEIEKSKVTIENVATSINLLDGTIGNETDIEYTLGTIPHKFTESDTLKVDVNRDGSIADDEKFVYLSMSYILVNDQTTGSNKAQVENVKYTFDSEGNDITLNEGLSQVPVQRNWRTNIIGQLLTGTINFKVIIDESYIDDYIYPEYSTIADGVSYDPINKIISLSNLNGLKWFANQTDNGSRATTIDTKNGTFEGLTIKLTQNIDMSSIDNWQPICSGQNTFKGTFDGGNYTISNLTVKTTNKASAGLFAKSQGYIKNLKIKNANITGHYKAAAIVADGMCAKIENCHVDGGTIISTPHENNDANHVGGIVGYLSGEPTAYVKNSSVKNMSIIAYRNVGGLVGTANKSAEISGSSVDNVTVIANQLVEYEEPGKADKPGQIVGKTHADAVISEDNVHNNVTANQLAPDAEGKVVLPANVPLSVISQITNPEVKEIVMSEDITGNAGTSNGYGAAGVVINNNMTFDGGDNVLSVNKANGTWDSAVNPKSGTIKNVTIKSAFRGIFMSGATGDVHIENVIIDDVCYAFNSDAGSKDYGVYIKRSTLNGWTSFSNVHKEVVFTECNFGKGTGSYQYAFCRPYNNPTTFENCDFESGYELDPNKSESIVLKNCTYAGVPLTEKNISILIGEDKPDNISVIYESEITELNVNSPEAMVAAINLLESNSNVTINMEKGTYIIPEAAQGKTLTFVGKGNPEDVKVAVTKVGSGGENCDYGLDGSTVTFEGITITTNSSTYIGYARCKATYKNCIINGTYTLYDNSTFENCIFNVSGDVYNIWTWGATEATFTNCTFNSDGKAMLLYGTANTKLTINKCTFNDNGGLTDLKAAIEIGNDYNKSYELIVNNTTVNGYEINDKGINTGTTLWANKNSMGTDKLNVVVDGVDVY